MLMFFIKNVLLLIIVKLINKMDKLKKEITRQILAKAAIYKKQSKDKNLEP